MTEGRTDPAMAASTASTPSAQNTEPARTFTVANTPGERRRRPRSEPAGPALIELCAEVDIEVLDLSETGVLLSCDCPLVVGFRTKVQMLLGREPFVAWIEVTRVDEAQPPNVRGANRYLAGAVFTSLDDRSRRTLRQFLPREPQLSSRLPHD